MAKSNKNKKSINLLEPVYAPHDSFTLAYDWLVTIGKYLLIFVELIVLGVFFSRFILDRRNNNLSDEIGEQINLLKSEQWAENNILFPRYQKLLADVKSLKNGQKKNSSVVSEIVSGVPVTLRLSNFSFMEDNITMGFKATSLEEIKIYESAIKENERYGDPFFNITKKDSEIVVSASFSLVTKED